MINVDAAPVVTRVLRAVASIKVQLDGVYVLVGSSVILRSRPQPIPDAQRVLLLPVVAFHPQDAGAAVRRRLANHPLFRGDLELDLAPAVAVKRVVPVGGLSGFGDHGVVVVELRGVRQTCEEQRSDS